jgi:hypothetical protein
MGIGWSAGVIGTATAIHLAFGMQLCMHLKPDDGLVFHTLFYHQQPTQYSNIEID